MSTTLADYTSVAGHLPEEAFLGNLFIHTIREGAYRRDDIVAIFESLDLDATSVPEPSNAVDSFKKAITAHKETTYELPNGNIVSIMLREVTSKSPDKYIIRNLTREERDKSKSQLSYGSVGEFVLYKPDRKGVTRAYDESAARLAYKGVEHVLYPHILSSEWEQIKYLCEQIKFDYERHRTTLDGWRIRSLVREYIKNLGGIKIKDSIYFVPKAGAAEGRRLAEAVNHLGDCRMVTIPILDVVDQRDMIIEALQTDTEAQMTSLAQEIAKYSTKPTVASYSRLRGLYDDLTRRTQLYVDTLGTSIVRTEGSHEFVKAMLSDFHASLSKGFS